MSDRVTRFTSNKKGELKGNMMQKSVSVLKSSSSQSNNINVSQSQQGIQNNININVNNLIINNTNDQNSLYPDNYGVYLANSSFFTKLGNSIVNSKVTSSGSKNMGKRYQSQPRLTTKKKVGTNENIEVTKLIVNNVYSNNFDAENVNENNFGEAPGVMNNPYKEGNGALDPDDSMFKSSSCIINNSLINSVINNILDQNKNNINSIPTKYHIKNNVTYKSLSDLSPSSKVKVNEDNTANEVCVDLSLSRSLNLKEYNNSEVTIVVNDDVMINHAALWELMIDLEISSDTKHYLASVSSKLLKQLEEEILEKEINFEIFSNNVLNKVYSKIFKIVCIQIIYLKYISLDYNYENNMRNNVKRLIGSINEHLLNLIENFVLAMENYHNKYFTSEFKDKFVRLCRHHRIKRNNKEMAMTNLINSMYKNLETAINSVKQFSSNFFKVGYFKPLHTICFELFRSIDNYSLHNIISLITTNILYYLIHAESTIREKLANPSTTNKQTILNAVFLGLGMGVNVPTPFLPAVDNDTYTLVLDLDETLVHFFFVINHYI